MNDMTSQIQPEQIEQVVLLIRGQRVMLDRDLAALYGVETKNLSKAVQRNLERFPADFMFQLTAEEAEASRFQFGTLKRGQHFKYLPRVLSDQCVTAEITDPPTFVRWFRSSCSDIPIWHFKFSRA